MTHMKTALSIEKSLFDRMEHLSRSMKISRSRLYSLAIRDYLEKMDHEQILERINAACADMPDEVEKKWFESTAHTHGAQVEGEWK
jgi:metal-responsive CopG/Arc/MetJ family transcriptional regulator